jgi:hypothetical protein
MKYIDTDNRTHFTTSVTDLHVKKNKFVRFAAMISSIALLVTIFASLMVFAFKSKLLNIQFDAFSPFQISPIFMVTCILMISIYFIVIPMSLMKNQDEHFLSIFYIDLSGFYIIMTLFLIGAFLIGIFLPKTYYSVSMILVMLLPSAACGFIIFRKIKTKKNVTWNTLLSFNMGNSMLFSFQIYMVMFCICDLITKSDVDQTLHTSLKADLGITISCLYGATAIAILTDFRDIMFALIYEIFVLGYLFKYDNLFDREVIANIVMASLVFISIIITVYKYGKLIFGYEDDEELIKSLEKDRAVSNRT